MFKLEIRSSGHNPDPLRRLATLRDILSASVGLWLATGVNATGTPTLFRATTCEGVYEGHLQGICTDRQGTIYWSWGNLLVKTDSQGRVLWQVPVAWHHGDLCFHEDKVYVAVNLGEFDEPPGSADSWVYVYDANDLSELARYPVPEVVHAAGGIACQNGRFIVVGGVPPGVNQNYLYEYDSRFRFRKRHVLASGYTKMGIQTATWANGSWWFGCYGAPGVLLRADNGFRLRGKWEFEAALGIAGLADGRFLVARNTLVPRLGHYGCVWVAEADENKGLVPVQFPAAKRGGLRPLVIAHRGASGYLREHTLPAKALAYAMGADCIEQDVVLSKDGVPVVLHDVQIDTVTDVAQRFPARKRSDGRYYAIDFTVAELKQLRVTERFHSETGEPVYLDRFPLWQSWFQIPTLEEEVELIRGLNKSTGRNVGIYPEIKAPSWHRKQGKDIGRAVLEVLGRHGYKTKADNVWVQCFEFEELKRIRHELGYQGRLILLLGKDNRALGTWDGLQQVAKVADGIGPSLGHVFRGMINGVLQATDLVKNAHALHLVVHPYTLRADELPGFAPTFEELCRVLFVEVGADGAFTDFPDRIAAFVQSLNN